MWPLSPCGLQSLGHTSFSPHLNSNLIPSSRQTHSFTLTFNPEAKP